MPIQSQQHEPAHESNVKEKESTLDKSHNVTKEAKPIESKENDKLDKLAK